MTLAKHAVGTATPRAKPARPCRALPCSLCLLVVEVDRRDGGDYVVQVACVDSLNSLDLSERVADVAQPLTAFCPTKNGRYV